MVHLEGDAVVDRALDGVGFERAAGIDGEHRVDIKALAEHLLLVEPDELRRHLIGRGRRGVRRRDDIAAAGVDFLRESERDGIAFMGFFVWLELAVRVTFNGHLTLFPTNSIAAIRISTRPRSWSTSAPSNGGTFQPSGSTGCTWSTPSPARACCEACWPPRGARSAAGM